MMLTNQILDSSNPLRDPDERSQLLKRSASVASLPTPPRTHCKRSRSRVRTSVSHNDSDRSGEDQSPGRKRRRTLGVLPSHDEDEKDENAFWTGRVGPSHGEKQEKKVVEVDKTKESSPSPAMLRYCPKALVSPPPSRRQPLIQPARPASVDRESPSAFEAFKTPTKPKATKIWPKRDSPNNPFLSDSSEKVKLVSEWDCSDEEEVVGEAWVHEGTPTPTFEEKPTITYVL
jgi:hypothetical protein